LLPCLDKRLKLLTGGSRELPARQQTLRALIDWSYDQLVPPEQRLFERLGIFVDGFTLDAVTAVCAEDGSDEFEVLDIVASLADKSLVVAEVDADPVRYRLLESTRAYALMKLDERAERGAVAARHLAYFAQLVQASEAADDRDHDSGALVAACAELGNVRAALAYAFAGPDAEIGARLLVASRQIWRRWSASAEGADRCEAAAAGGRFDAAITAQLRNVASYLAYKMGRTVVALEIAERAVPAARAAGDPAILFDALLCRALPLMFAGRVDEAEAQLAAARSALDRAPTTVQEVRLVEARGILQSWREDYAQAALAFAELARLHRSHRDVEGEINASSNLAECEHARGETQRAIAVVRGQLPNAQALGHYWNAFLLANLAGYLVAVEAIDEARIAARRAIELSITDPGAPLVMNAIEHFALTIAVGGEAERAARLLGFSEATRALHGFRRQHTELATYARLEALLARRYAPHELAALFEAGAALSPSAAAELALLTACAA
jgi:tetratricopeptide (TPR) repeat protein